MKALQTALLLLTALSIQAAPAADTNETVSVVSHGSDQVRDNSGRQIAAILPVSAVARVAPKGVSAAKPVHQPAETASTRWRKVTFAVPTSVGEAADFCGTTANKAGKVAAEKFLETAAWTNAYVKQIGKAPLITPAAEIVRPVPKTVQPLTFQHKSWYMPDGRVKTLTQK